jgi:hypothetical protein
MSFISVLFLGETNFCQFCNIFHSKILNLTFTFVPVAAQKIYKEHLECLTVRDEQFSPAMLANIFHRLANLPPAISTEILAK